MINWRQKHKKKKKKSLGPPAIRPEYQWLNQLNSNGGPSNPMAVPFDTRSISETPETTLAQKWIKDNCKFAQSK